MWRCVNNTLLVLSDIKKRGMKCQSVCSHCGEQEESVDHVFFERDKAAITWKLAPLSWEGMQGHNQSMKHWWLDMERAGQTGNLQEKIELTAYILWQIWKLVMIGILTE